MLHTWVVDHCHLAIGLFYLKVRRGWRDAQDIVVCRIDHHGEYKFGISVRKEIARTGIYFKRKSVGVVAIWERKNGEGQAQPSEIYRGLLGSGYAGCQRPTLTFGVAGRAATSIT